MRKSCQEQTGKSFYIENVDGAGGNTGTGRAAQSAPDGYTILVTGGNITNNPYLYNHVPFIRSRTSSRHARRQHAVVLVVNPSVPAYTFKELIALIRANPGKINMASPGTGRRPI